VQVADGYGGSLDPAELALSDTEPVGQLGLLDLGVLNRPVSAEEVTKMPTEQDCPDFRLFPEVGG
jgi:hypothetical protein